MTLILAVIALAAILGLVVAAWQSPPRSTYQIANQSKPEHSQKDATPEKLGGSDQQGKTGAQEQKSQNYWERFVGWVERREKAVMALGTIAIAAFTFTLFVATILLFVATRDLVHEAETSSAREQRAYVYAAMGSRVWPPAPATPDRHSILVTIRNSGKTWARDLRVQRASIPNPPSDAWESVDWTKAPATPLLLGPGQDFSLQFGDIDAAAHQQLVSGALRMFYAVRLRYEDALSHPPAIRETQLYVQLNGDREGFISFSFMPTHNCADEDCHHR